AVEEGHLADGGRRLDDPAGAAREDRLQAPVGEEVERAVELALADQPVAGAHPTRVGVGEHDVPVPLRAGGQQARLGCRPVADEGRVREERRGVHGDQGSIRVTVSLPWLTTQTESAPAAMPSGSLPTGIAVPTTFPVRGSIRVTLLSSLLATQTKPRPTVSSRGLRPTLIGVPIARPDCGS